MPKDTSGNSYSGTITTVSADFTWADEENGIYVNTVNSPSTLVKISVGNLIWFRSLNNGVTWSSAKSILVQRGNQTLRL